MWVSGGIGDGTYWDWISICDNKGNDRPLSFVSTTIVLYTSVHTYAEFTDLFAVYTVSSSDCVGIKPQLSACGKNFQLNKEWELVLKSGFKDPLKNFFANIFFKPGLRNFVDTVGSAHYASLMNISTNNAILPNNVRYRSQAKSTKRYDILLELPPETCVSLEIIENLHIEESFCNVSVMMVSIRNQLLGEPQSKTLDTEILPPEYSHRTIMSCVGTLKANPSGHAVHVYQDDHIFLKPIISDEFDCIGIYRAEISARDDGQFSLNLQLNTWRTPKLTVSQSNPLFIPAENFEPTKVNTYVHAFYNLLFSCSHVQMKLDSKCHLPSLHVTREIYLYGHKVSSVIFKVSTEKSILFKHPPYSLDEVKNRIFWGIKPKIEVMYYVHDGQAYRHKCKILLEKTYSNECKSFPDVSNMNVIKADSSVSWLEAESACISGNMSFASVKSDVDVLSIISGMQLTTILDGHDLESSFYIGLTYQVNALFILQIFSMVFNTFSLFGTKIFFVWYVSGQVQSLSYDSTKNASHGPNCCAKGKCKSC